MMILAACPSQAPSLQVAKPDPKLPQVGARGAGLGEKRDGGAGSEEATSETEGRARDCSDQHSWCSRPRGETRGRWRFYTDTEIDPGGAGLRGVQCSLCMQCLPL